MTAPAKHLARGLDIHFSTTIGNFPEEVSRVIRARVTKNGRTVRKR